MAKLMREVRPHQVMQLAADDKGFTLREIQRRMGELGVEVGYGYLSDIMNGKRQHPDHDIRGALLVVLGLDLEDIGMQPAQAPTLYLAMRALADGHEWPDPDHGGRAADDQGESYSQDKTGFTGHSAFPRALTTSLVA